MKTRSRYAFSLVAALAIVAAPALAQEGDQAAKLKVEDQVLLSATATVKSLDVKTRELTLKSAAGDEVTVTVDDSVKRLPEIKVGDDVTVRYYVSLAAELREPTAEEKKNPLVVAAGMAKAPKDASPGAGGLHMFRVVATVEGLERPSRLLTLKGPRGNYLTVRARDVNKLEQLRLGDTIVVTFTEALAVSVEPAMVKSKQ